MHITLMQLRFYRMHFLLVYCRLVEKNPHFIFHDDVIKWKHFPRYWPFVRRNHRSTVNSPHIGQSLGALKFSLICISNNRLSEQSWSWWFETPSRLLWHHCHVTHMCNISQSSFSPCHMYASLNWVIISSGNGLSPVRRQAIAWANGDLLSIGPLGTNFSEIRTKNFHSWKCIWKCCLRKWRPFTFRCLDTFYTGETDDVGCSRRHQS